MGRLELGPNEEITGEAIEAEFDGEMVAEVR